jgi:hypothetical protein
MRITEAMRKAGYAIIDGKKVPLQESSPERQTELRESLIRSFMVCGHTLEEARIAARGRDGEEILDAFAVVEGQRLSRDQRTQEFVETARLGGSNAGMVRTQHEKRTPAQTKADIVESCVATGMTRAEAENFYSQGHRG